MEARRTESVAVADLGFGKGGCPIHQKGAPESAKPRHAQVKVAPNWATIFKYEAKTMTGDKHTKMN